MYFGIKSSEFDYIFLTSLGTEIINTHKVPSPEAITLAISLP